MVAPIDLRLSGKNPSRVYIDIFHPDSKRLPHQLRATYTRFPRIAISYPPARPRRPPFLYLCIRWRVLSLHLAHLHGAIIAAELLPVGTLTLALTTCLPLPLVHEPGSLRLNGSMIDFTVPTLWRAEYLFPSKEFCRFYQNPVSFGIFRRSNSYKAMRAPPPLPATPQLR